MISYYLPGFTNQKFVKTGRFFWGLLTFALMKKRLSLINSVLATAVLFSMLVQSLHSFEHLSKLFSEKECHHKYTGKTEVSHQHHPFDECFVCEFTLSAFVHPALYAFSFPVIENHLPVLNRTAESIISFSGITYSLRGPPTAIA